MAQVRVVASAFLRARPWIVAPAMLASLVSVSRVEGMGPRLSLMAGGMGTMFALFVGEAISCRRRHVTQTWLALSLWLTTLGIGAMCLLTGGIQSPVAVLMCAPVAVGFAAFGRAAAGLLIAAWALLLLSALAVVPHNWPFIALPDPIARRIAWVALAVTLALFLAGVGGLREGFADAMSRGDRLRRAAIDTASTRAASLERLAIELGHELKNPLASIKGLLQLTERSADDAGSRRAAVMLTEVERMQQILHDYLTFTRPFAPLALASIPVRALIDEVVDVAQPRAMSGNVTLVTDIAADFDTTVTIDRSRLRDAMINLLVNAIEASTPGQRVLVTVAHDDQCTRIGIEDHGPGLPTEVHERIGTPFLTTKADGTGVGVAIAKAIIERHGGHLHYPRSTTGTRAIIELPHRQPSASATT